MAKRFALPHQLVGFLVVFAEVIYASDNHKKIIPLVVEHRYKPHGWLQFHTSDGLRLDFSREDSFEDSFKKLLKQLKKFFKTVIASPTRKGKLSYVVYARLFSTDVKYCANGLLMCSLACLAVCSIAAKCLRVTIRFLFKRSTQKRPN